MCTQEMEIACVYKLGTAESSGSRMTEEMPSPTIFQAAVIGISKTKITTD